MGMGIKGIQPHFPGINEGLQGYFHFNVFLQVDAFLIGFVKLPTADFQLVQPVCQVKGMRTLAVHRFKPA
jgi:hypothetical protein